MKKVIFYCLFIFSFILKAQTTFAPSINFSPSQFGKDFKILDREPLGHITGVLNKGILYVAIADSFNSNPNCMVLYRSLDTGKTWSMYTYFGASSKIKSFQLISQNDTLYSSMLTGSTYSIFNFDSWKVNTNQFATDWEKTHLVISKSGSYHLFIDSSSTIIYRMTSKDYGKTWTGGRVTSRGDNMQLNSSYDGDSIIVSYWNGVFPNNTSDILTLAYKEESGSIFRTTIDTLKADGRQKNEFIPSITTQWRSIFFTTGARDSIKLWAHESVDTGKTFNDTELFPYYSQYDQYWFDIKPYVALPYNYLITYIDSLQVGAQNNNTDKLVNNNYIISEHSPYWSPKMFKPVILSLYDLNNIDEFAAIWVGQDEFGKSGVYFDRMNNTISGIVENEILPENFNLSQNFPNPFNPSTTINYNLPRESFVNLSVYNILGEKVMTLINGMIPAGNHHVQFDGKSFATGMYIYKLEADGFSSTKKMMLVK